MPRGDLLASIVPSFEAPSSLKIHERVHTRKATFFAVMSVMRLFAKEGISRLTSATATTQSQEKSHACWLQRLATLRFIPTSVWLFVTSLRLDTLESRRSKAVDWLANSLSLCLEQAHRDPVSRRNTLPKKLIQTWDGKHEANCSKKTRKRSNDSCVY